MINHVLPFFFQVIPLNAENGTVGCTKSIVDGVPTIFCRGVRTLKSSDPRTWYVALSRCGSTQQIVLNYVFSISGYYGQCEDDPLANTRIPVVDVSRDNTNIQVAIAMGVIAGIAIVVAIVFVILFIRSRREINQKPKPTGSVTSSQATMTQDIFYVNPSLSDREHSDSQYSRSSSENYYEVIPDRRSYESINTQLALHGHNGRTLNLAIPRDPRSRIPSYIFEDIPPPPYQPPNLQGQGHGHNHQGSNTSHQSQGSGSGHPLLGTQSPYSGGGLQHIPMSARFIPISTAPGSMSGPVTMATTTRMPLHSSSNTNGLVSSNPSSSQHVPNHSSVGNFHSSAGSSAGNQENLTSGITTSAGGLSSHGANTIPRSQMSDNGNTTLPTEGAPIQNGGATVGRYPLHNTNHAKLLNHAFRIQQFETTA